MKDVELKEADQEKQLMTREKNGCVKVTVPDSPGVKYTGLSKDQLIQIAGTAGWIRTRWALLVLFFLGWVGMLAGAIAIIVQAPRCKPIPEMNWWNEGPLYQISDLNSFSDNGLKGVEEKLEYLSQMKVKGLVLGPIHAVMKDQLETLSLTSVNSKVGNENDLDALLDRAHKKGISIVLNLTPNYEGASAWFNSVTAIAEKIKVACTYWLKKGFSGIFLTDIGRIIETGSWSSIQAIFNQTYRALMGSSSGSSVENASVLLNRSGVDLLLSKLPDPGESGVKELIQKLCSTHQQTSLAWDLRQILGSQSSKTPGVPVRLHQLLLLTLPGTPLFSAGDEVGLKAGEEPRSMWGSESPAEETNTEAKERLSVLNFFKTLSDLRGKERALLHGHCFSLSASDSSSAFLRLWDQSERFLSALNWGKDTVTLRLMGHDLPAQAQVRLSTDTQSLAVDSMVSLKSFELGPGQAVLMSYPHAG